MSDARASKMKRGVQFLPQGIRSLSKILNLVGVSFLVVLMLLTTVDVIGRYFLNRPVKGTLELSEYFMAVVIMLGLAYTALVRGHIRIELLVSRWTPKTQHILDAVGSLACAAISALIVWQGVLEALSAKGSGLVSDILGVPAFPFKFLVPLGASVLCLVLFLQFFESLDKAIRLKGEN